MIEAAFLRAILACPNVASKEWVIRQYDHEVQGGSVIKPLVGVQNDAPGDAAVIRPDLESYRGLAISCGINPLFGDLDPHAMAASAVDEAVRNCVAVGADPERIALLDNFCWGNTERPETLGSLVRAALGCQETATGLGTPFISGKDSLNNEFTTSSATGGAQTIAIPGTLLVSALGHVPDVRHGVTMDLKEAGNDLYLIGLTRAELGGSHYGLVTAQDRLGPPPRVDVVRARQTFAALHQAIRRGVVRACHDLSEGGLAVALAEMAFAGKLGATVDLDALAVEMDPAFRVPAVLLFSESNSRFLCEVPARDRDAWEDCLGDIPCARIGQVTERLQLLIHHAASSSPLIDESLSDLKAAWQRPFV